ncbi:L,D-transpeptidase family protein [Desulforudis sp. 1088]|uniref:L,D-transpeptidase family protein n=1 Tax=unclassified Candidatus Desulforudis TaxID=2635950 RepID=UPI003CE4BB67
MKNLRYTLLVLALVFASVFGMPGKALAGPYFVCPVDCDSISTLYPYAKGPAEDIMALQQELKQIGLYAGAINGIYDARTLAAVCKFQTMNHLEPNGIVDANTWGVLARSVEPVIKKRTPPPKGEVAIVIDTRTRKLIVMDDGMPHRVFPCAVGKPETPSPVGNWKIKRKAAHWGSGFGSRWMGLSVPWGIYGIHGTNKPGSIGTYASHGCIRMFNSHVEELYRWVKVGTPVYIIGNPLGPYPRPVLVLNSREPAVVEVQRVLAKKGYYNGPVDGIFGSAMLKAVIQFRKDNKLPYDNRVDGKMYELLGL